MEKKIKIGVYIILVALLSFLIFRNFRIVNDVERELPSNEELNEFNNVQSKSNANSYEVKDIPDKELATIYYNHFKNLVVNNSSEAYNRVRNKDNMPIEKFNLFRDSLVNDYYNNKVASYRISDNTYKIVNSNNQTIIFYVDAVYKYEVELLF